MTIASSIQSIDFLTAIRESALVYPFLRHPLDVHRGIRRHDPDDRSAAVGGYLHPDHHGGGDQPRPWKRLGGVIMITVGLLLGTSEAEKYAPNPYFWTKMTLLTLIGIHALVFRPIVYNKTEELDRSPVIPAGRRQPRTFPWFCGPACSPWEGSSLITSRSNPRPRRLCDSL